MKIKEIRKQKHPIWPYLSSSEKLRLAFSLSGTPPQAEGSPLFFLKNPLFLYRSLPPFFFFPPALSFSVFLLLFSSSASQSSPVPSAAQKLCPLCSLRAPKHSPPIMSSPGKIKLKILQKAPLPGVYRDPSF